MSRAGPTKTFWICVTFLGLVSVLALAAPWLTPYTYYDQDLGDRLTGPTLAHWMGTDVLGRDLLARILFGARMSLAVGVVTAVCALVIGTGVGAAAGYLGGLVDRFFLRAADLISALPPVLVAILLMLFVGRGFTGIFLALALLAWIPQARLVRAQVLQTRELAYVEAARALGVPPIAIVFRHLLPNVLGPMVVSLSMQVPSAIMAESFLSFIGLGLQPPYSSWGTLANEGFRGMRSYPHLILFPGGVLFLVLLAFNYLGDELRAWLGRGVAFALALVTFTGCAGSPPKKVRTIEKPPSISIELTHLTRDEWQIDYRLSNYVSGLIFLEQDSSFRHEDWKPMFNHHFWKQAGDQEIVVCKDPNGCDRFQFRFKTKLHPFAREYEFFHAFEDGARIIFLRYLRAQPWLCAGAPDPDSPEAETCVQELETMGEAMNLFTKLPERIYANGIATDVKHFSVRGPRRYAYFGAGRIIDQTWKDDIVDTEPRITSWIFDEKMPRWIQDLVPAKLPKIFGVYASEVGRKFPVTTELMLGYEHSEENRLELRASNVLGQVQATLSGKAWKTRSRESVHRLVSVLIHELAHTWSSQISVESKGQASWVTEGGTDALAYAAALRSGFTGQDEFRGFWESALNRCLVGLSSKLPLDEDPGPDGTYRPLYACGSIFWLALGASHRPKDPAAGILELWNFLLTDLRSKNRVTETDVLETFRRRSLPPHAVDAIRKVASGSGDRRMALLGMLKNAGLRVALHSGEVDAETRLDLAHHLLRQLIPPVCRGDRIFDQAMGFRIQPQKGCNLFSTSFDAYAIDGTNIMKNAAKAYDRATGSCVKKHRVTLQGTPRGVTTGCARLEPKPQFFRFTSL